MVNTSNPTDVFTRMLHAIDTKNWPGVRQAFADDVDVDYSSLFGVAAARTTADELVGGWERFASAFTATQHLTGPFVVMSSGDRVQAGTHVRAYHQMRGVSGGEIWMVAGHYEIQLMPVGDGWKISGITLRVFYQEGNLSIPAAARDRAASSRATS
jgi:hypothetical protein